MAAEIPARLRDLLAPEKKALAFLALVKADGAPQVTPVWFDWDGTHLVINTARGRVKDQILHRGGQAAVAIVDPDDPYRYLQIQARVDGETEEGGYEQICRLSYKYRGHTNFPKRPGEVRVTYRLKPERVSGE